MPKDNHEPANEYERYSDYFGEPEVKSSIFEAADQTNPWLMENSESYGPDGHLNQGKGWWPRLTATNDSMLLEERGRMLRARIFEHGILHFYWKLVRGNVVPKSDELHDFIRTSDVNVWWRQLRARDLAPSQPAMSLSKFRDTGTFGTRTTPSKCHPHLLKMCILGMAIAKRNMSGDYAIFIGPSGLAFYDKVYFPVLQEFNDRINPGKNDG